MLDYHILHFILYLILFQIVGMMMLLSGMMAHSLYKDYLNFLNHQLLNLPVLVFLTGVVMTGVACQGLLGSCLSSRRLLYSYSASLVLLVLLEMGAGLLYYYHIDQVLGGVISCCIIVPLVKCFNASRYNCMIV